MTTNMPEKSEARDAPKTTEADESGPATDAVFGEITEGGPNYRNVGWIGTIALMMKTQIGLGVLSIPTAFNTLGLVPGVICLLTVAAITTWSNWIVGVFKLRHREVYGIDDAGALMFGRIGREVLSTAFCLYWIFVAGSAMLGTSIGLNTISNHGTCTAVFVAIAAFVGFVFSSVRTLGGISWIAWFGLTSVIVSIVAVTIAVGVQDRPAAAPAPTTTGPWHSDYKIINDPPFHEAVSAISTLIFAYAGTGAFFPIAAEMRDPRHYTRSLLLCQAVVTATYLTIGVVVYYYCGSYVASPALGSAGPLMKKVCYGLGIPGLVVSTLLDIHFAAKYVFVRMLRGSKHLTSNSLTHWATWLGCTFACTIIAYLIASGIPVFGGLVSLVGALLGTLQSFQPMGCMWLYDNWHRERTLKWGLKVTWSVFVITSGTFLMVSGTYGSIVGIINSPERTASWSCADNSNSV